VWAIAARPGVVGPTPFELPDGSIVSYGQGIAGTFYPMTLFIEE
jgi:hypothetical protein